MNMDVKPAIKLLETEFSSTSKSTMIKLVSFREYKDGSTYANQ
jgi:hypothetical protein